MDHEREDAEDWKIDARPLVRRVLREVPNFVTDPDTSGRAAWRHKEEPQAVISISHKIASTKSPGRAGNQRTLFEYFPQLQRIQANTQTYISPRPHQKGKDNTTIEIWGKRGQVNYAAKQIRVWLAETKEKTHEAFPRVPSTAGERSKEIDADLEKEELKQSWRRDPPDNIIHEAIGVFVWPAEFKSPDLYLGNNLEAIDSIRMDCSCWITYKRNTSWFTVLGSGTSDITSAIRRLRAIIYQITARAIDTMELLLVKSGLNSESSVTFIPYSTDTTQKKYTAKIDATLLPTLGTHDEKAAGFETTDAENTRKFKNLIMKTLPGLQYYCGNIKMVARLGTFITRPHNGVKTLREWQDMIKQPECECEVTAELGNKRMEDALFGRFSAANSVLTPIGGKASTSLRDMTPVYGASFFLKSEDEKPGTVRLDLEYQADSSGHLDFSSVKWSRADQQTGEAITIMAANLIDVEKALAWQVCITAGFVVDESRYSILEQFRKLVQVDHKIATDPKKYDTENFITWKRVDKLKVLSGVQKMIYRYGIGEGNYLCEMVKSKDLLVAKENVAGKPSRWAVNVSSTDWARNLDQNAHVQIGEGVGWEAKSDAFFGGDGSGIEDLMTTLDVVSAIVNGDTPDPTSFATAKLSRSSKVSQNLTIMKSNKSSKTPQVPAATKPGQSSESSKKTTTAQRIDNHQYQQNIEFLLGLCPNKPVDELISLLEKNNHDAHKAAEMLLAEDPKEAKQYEDYSTYVAEAGPSTRKH